MKESSVVRESGVVSVVVVNYRGADDTIECVRQLGDVDWPATDLEIVVVENGSGDDSLARLRAAFAGDARVKLVESAENLGFAGGSNLGARSARGEFVAFLNSDAKPAPGWIRGAVVQFETSPAVAAVGSKVLDWEGKVVDFVGGSLTWFGMGYKDHENQPDDERFQAPRDILYGTGSALFVRAATFEEVGGFDERFFMFYEDVDLGWRLNLLGHRVRFAPESVVFHKHHASMRSFGPYRESYLLERNALATLYKNLGAENLARFLPGAMALLARRAVAKSDLDSQLFDIRRFSGGADEFDETTPVAKESLAGLFALDQFVEELESLSVTRDDIQGRRRRTDAELFRLFGNMIHPLLGGSSYLSGFRAVVDAFEIESSTDRRRILVITGDSLGEKMAGPGLRAWKISEALSAEHDVRLITWNAANRFSDRFEVEHVQLQNERQMKVHEQWADVIFFQGYALHHFTTLQKSEKIVVADIYDPMHLEQLEQGREFGTERWTNIVRSATEVLNQQLARADFFLCASERQRLFWLGQLAALGRINPANYAADDSLDELISIAPFGLDSTPPRHTRDAIRGVVPGIGKADKVIIWGGGIYNWFDTLTLVRAVGKLAETRRNVRLFFMGTAHPNPDVPEMAVVQKTRQLAAELGLTGTHVFFNDSWVDLDDRQNYLLEADVGVSTHFDHIETTFSFRTRILDYLWAGLPIVTTGGDSFGDLVEKEGLGVSVAERDVDALAEALERMLYEAPARKAAVAAVARVREEFTWERTLAPLVAFCRDPHPAADRVLGSLSAPLELGAGGRRTRPVTTEEKFQAISTRRHGLRRDVALARHYLTNGGLGSLGGKIRSRLAYRKAGKA
ncbi:glycosyltransferase [Herbiconiux sp. CPCC 203407]|uniref:Glycosyltransferase n=1 Tax=Herbiconiux oxytropis TaxID=2970915 RepID=A0AA42BSS3_9MICO|nr:glycosyltransferase [Herbiconiux oxytropis]MCS5722032.1 glycosyltransferase [Herbiconiux oxytropis]MCS5725615.1 glycosyltransferase [Herbiconiux oxytropis]